MIFKNSIIDVADNSGVKKVKCIGFLNNKKKYAKLKEIIKVSLKKTKKNSNIKKGKLYYAMIIKTKRNINRNTGYSIKFNKNSVILLDDKLEPIANKIIEICPKELTNTDIKEFIKIKKLI